MNENNKEMSRLDRMLKAAEAYKFNAVYIENIEHILNTPNIRVMSVDELQVRIPNEISVEMTGRFKDILSEVLAKCTDDQVFIRNYLLGVVDENGKPITKDKSPSEALDNFGEVVNEFFGTTEF